MHGFTVPFMFPSISCEFIDFESLKRGYLSWITLTKKILANSGLIEIFFFSNYFTYILEGYLSDSIKTGCILSFCRTKSDRTNRRDWVRLVRLNSVIELTSSINRTHRKVPVGLLDHRTNRTRIWSIGFDWVRLIFGSVSFDWLRREFTIKWVFFYVFKP